MNVIGLDLSSTCTGICLPDGTTEHFRPAAGTLLDRALETKRWLTDWVLPADLVVIEAIGTRFVNTAIAMAYMHGHVDHLLQDTPTLKVAPTMLKRFATGKGVADKHAMTVTAIRNGWNSDGDEGSTDDEADAWWLWALGMAYLGLWRVPETGYRLAVLETLHKVVAA